MNYASRDDFWKFHDREYKEVTSPQIGKVCIRSLSDGEQRSLSVRGRDEFGRLTEPENLFAYRAIAQLVDVETKEPMFGDIDLERLSSMRYSVTRPLMDAMLDFAQGSDTQPDDPDEADAAEKKSS